MNKPSPRSSDSSTRIFSRTVLAAAVAACFAPPLQASTAPGAAIGPEFRVDTQIGDGQGLSGIATDADGDFVVVWSAPDAHFDGVYARRFDAAGLPQGGEFLVNAETNGNQIGGTVAMDADGDFVVVWTSGSDQDGDGTGVYAQRYSAAGIALGGEFQVNEATTGDQGYPSVAMDANGDFVVTWGSYQNGSYSDVYARRYNASGVAEAGEFQVNQHSTGYQGVPAVAMDASGDFVLTWTSFDQDGSDYGVYARRYNAAGVAEDNEFLVNTVTDGRQTNSNVAMDADGDFVVAWVGEDYGLTDTGVYAQRYNAAGVAQGVEFRANTYTTDFQRPAAVALDADGDFVIAWASAYQDGSRASVYAQRYSANGAAQGGEFPVNSFTTGTQAGAEIALDADGDFVVAWQNFDGDGSTGGVFARRYAGPEPVDVGLAIADVPDPVSAGAALAYSYTVSNQHAAVTPTGVAAIDAAIGAATELVLDTALPAGFSYQGFSGTDWSCDEDSGAIRCSYGTALAAGSGSSVTIDAMAGSVPGSYGISALATARQFDPDEGDPGSDNEASASTDVGGDTSPDPFAFPNRRDVQTATLIVSGTVTPAGYAVPAAISMLGAGEYSIAGGGFTSVPGTITPGQTLRLRQLSPSQVNRENQVKVKIGGTVAGFRVRTRAFAGDVDPNAFNFNNSMNLPTNTLVQSKPYMPIGYDSPAPVSVSGGDYSIDGAAFTAVAGTISPGSTLRVRTTSPATNDTRFEVQLQIGNTRAKWLGKTLP